MANEILMAFESGISKNIPQTQFKSSILKEHTIAIFNLMNATKQNMFEIAIRLTTIRNEKLYEYDGYEDIFDYAASVLGYKRNFVYKLTMAAEKFIEQNADEKSYASIIVHDDRDYTVSQLVELNSLTSPTVIELDENGVITPEMTTKEIREVVKKFKNNIIDIKGNTANNENNEENTANEEKKTADDFSNTINTIIAECTNLLKDKRVINNVKFAKKVKTFKKACEEFN